uniref:Spy0128 family protein n=1 Tax=Eubacterium cellulosolvens TaxID=29322 RepID=UPI0004879FF6|nr:FctA domain-containing protein [[Eubacterium] cellulosolvens]
MSKRFKSALAMLLSVSMILGSNGTAVFADALTNDSGAAQTAQSESSLSDEASGGYAGSGTCGSSANSTDMEESGTVADGAEDRGINGEVSDADAESTVTATPQADGSDGKGTRTEYTFESEEVRVTAVLSDPGAVSDRAELKVTKLPKAEQTSCMRILNRLSDGREDYTDDDTLFYGIGFFCDGQLVDTKTGSVRYTVAFKKNQLRSLLRSTEGGDGIYSVAAGENVTAGNRADLEVKQVLSSKTADGSRGNTYDSAENVQGLQVDIENEQVSFSAGNASAFSFHREDEKAAAADATLVGGAGITSVVNFCYTDGVPVNGVNIPQNKFYVVYSNRSECAAVALNQAGALTLNEAEKYNSNWPWEYQGKKALSDAKYEFHLYAINDGAGFVADGTNAKTLRDDTNIRTEITNGSTVKIDGREYTVSIEGLEKADAWNPQLLLDYPKTSDYRINFVEKVNADLTLELTFDEAPSFRSEDHASVFVEAEVVDANGQKQNVYYMKSLSEVHEKETKILIANTDWKLSNGSDAVNVTYAGGEVKATVVKTDTNEPNIADTQSGQSYISRVNENGLVCAYRVNYGALKEADYSGRTDKHMVLPVSFRKVKVTNDYDYLSVVGPGYLYGITADTYRQQHEIQSNFATNHYYSGGNEIQPNLAGTDGGLVAIAHSEDGREVRIARDSAGVLVVYIDETQTSLVKDESSSQMAVTIGMNRAEISANMVNPALNHSAQISASLGSHEATIDPAEDARCVDARYFDDNTTIYVNADKLPSLGSAGFTIRKKPGQMIVFNFSNSSPVLQQFVVEEYGDDGNLIRSVSSTETHAVGDEHNAELNTAICQKIVWNIQNGNLTLDGSSAGIYLVPNGDVMANQSCTGWLLGGAGHEVETRQEWHYVYAENPQVDRASLQASKTVDGALARNYQKFIFVLEKYDPFTKSWQEIGRTENSGSVVKFETANMNDQYNAYRIREIDKAQSTEGGYILDTRMIYARVKYFVVKSTSGKNQVAVAGAPEYYSSFREGDFGAANGNGFSGRIEDTATTPFANRTKTASLTLGKTVTDNYVTDQSFTFEVTIQRPVLDDDGNATGAFTNLSGEFDTDRNTKVTFSGGKAKVTLKAGETITIDGLKYGDVYTVREVNLPDGFRLADGQAKTVTGTVSTDTENAAEVSFANTYRAEGSALITGAKKLSGRDFKKGDSATFELKPDLLRNPLAPLPNPSTVTVNPSSGNTVDFSFAEIRYTLANLEGAKEKTFYYYVSEKEFSMDGAAKDASVKPVAVTVTDNGKGKLETRVRLDDTNDTFVNTYAAVGTTEIGGVKTLENRKFKKGDSMTFVLTPEIKDTAQQPMPAKSTVTIEPTGGQSASFRFGELKFTNGMLEGAVTRDFRYTITETASMSGVTNDSGSHTLVVRVTDNLDGTLRVEKKYTNSTAPDVTDQAAFVNTYHADGVISMTGTKQMTGRDFRKGDTWRFKVSCSEVNAPMPSNKEVTISPDSGDTAVLDFGEIHYSLEDAGKTYIYTITENGDVPGVTNDSGQTMTVSVSDDGSGKLVIHSSFGSGSAIRFVNRYDAKGQTSVDGEKYLQNRKYKAGDSFAFVIRADENNADAPLPEKTRVVIRPTDGQSAAFSFGNVHYTLADLDGKEQRTFRYVIAEEADVDHVKNDKGTHTLAVKVTDQHDGTLKVEKTFDNSNAEKKTDRAYFVNIYEASGSVKLAGRKVLTGRDFHSGDSFTFKLSGNGPLPSVCEKTIMPTDGNLADVDFGTISYSLKDLTENGKVAEEKTFTYGVKEEASVSGVTNDKGIHTVEVTVSDAEHDGTLRVTAVYRNVYGKKESTTEDGFEFVNTYDAAGSVKLAGVKNIENREFHSGDSWTFTLGSTQSDAPLPAKTSVSIRPENGNTAGFAFDEISYKLSDLAGASSRSFVYTIAESGNVAGVQNDTEAHTVTVTVTDNGDGTLAAVPVYSDEGGKASFTNVYGADGTFVLSGSKQITGRKFRTGDRWTFTVKAVDPEAPLPEKTEVIVTPDAETTTAPISFGKIRFGDEIFRSVKAAKDGSRTRTFVYEVAESGRVSGVTNDAKEKHTVTVTVVDDGNGNITSNAVYSDGNALVFVNNYDASGSADLRGVKNLERRAFRAGDTWTFTISADEDGAPLPEKTSVTIEPEKGETAGFAFGNVKYELADLGGKDSRSFVYTVKESGTVKGVQNDGTAHKITVDVKDLKNGKLEVKTSSGENGEGLVFTNTYDAEGKTVIEGEKVIDTRDFHSGDFAEFEISANEKNPDAPLPAKTTVSVRPNAGRSEKFAFGEIRFTLDDLKVTGEDGTATYAETKKFIYDIREVSATMAGTERDEHTAQVVVTVTDQHDGTLKVQKTCQNGELRFENRYQAKGSVSIAGTKTIVGRSFGKKDAWTFIMTAEDADAPLPSPAAVTIHPKEGNTEKFTFADITYTLADLKGKTSRKFTYTVSESGTIKGVSNDRAAKKVLVSVSDNGDGTLEVVPEYAGGALSFTNTYAAKGQASLTGTKTIEGRSFREGDAWTFTVKAEDSKTPMPQRTELTIRPCSGNVAVLDFGPIPYTLADVGKTYVYTVYESGKIEGVTNDKAVHTVTVSVKDNGEGGLDIVETYSDGEALSFTNIYDATGSTTVQGTKKIEGRSFRKGDSWTFALSSDDERAPLPVPSEITVAPENGNEKNFSFPEIHYSLSDLGGKDSRTFIYKVKESGKVEGVTNDSAQTVAVTVTDNKDGTLTAVPDYGKNADGTEKDEAVFVNRYDASGRATVSVTKKITGRLFQEGDAWTFRIRPASETPDAPLPEKTEVTIHPDESSAETFAFDEIAYTLSDLEGEDSKEFQYVITESGKVDGVTNDAAEHTVSVTATDLKNGKIETKVSGEDGENAVFVNRYDAAGQTVLEGEKQILGRPFKSGDSWTFEITPVTAGAPMPEKTEVTVSPKKGDGYSKAFRFGTLKVTLEDLKNENGTYAKEKTFVYQVTETGKVAGVQNDPEIHTVSVKVTDNRNGKLDVTPSYSDGGAVIFRNTYGASGTFILAGRKMIENREFREGDEWSFEVTADGADVPMPEKTTVTINPTEGVSAAFSFGEIKYTLADAGKTYTYTVTESGSVSGVTNDAKKHTVKVRVSDDGEGGIIAQPEYSDGKALSFTNIYDAKGSAVLRGVKNLENRAFRKGDAWIFRISSDDEKAPLPENREVTINPASGNAAEIGFGEIRYNLSDLDGEHQKIFHYTLSESGKVNGVTNDQAEHSVDVTVTDNMDGTLSVVPAYNDNDMAVFTNTYHASGEIRLHGVKRIDNRDFHAGDSATFTITGDGKLPAPASVTIHPTDGREEAFVFNRIAYTLDDLKNEDGTYADNRVFTYEVTESAEMAGTVTDADTHRVTVTVTDKKDGTLSVTAAYADEKKDAGTGFVFLNRYDAQGEATVNGVKNIENRNFKEGDAWTFTMNAVDKNAPLPEPASVTIRPTEGGAAEFAFAPIRYSLSDLDGRTEKTFHYNVTESGRVRGVTNDSAAHGVDIRVSDNGDGTLTAVPVYKDGTELKFVNTYGADGRFALKGTKTLTGRHFRKGDAWTFTVRADREDAPMPEKTSVTIRPEEGSVEAVDFGTITYGLKDRDRTYTYTVTESGEIDGVENDERVHSVKVHISDDGNGGLIAEPSYSRAALDFENTYDASGETGIEGVKEITGRDFVKGDAWTFAIKGSGGAPMPEKTEVTIHPEEDEEAAFDFGVVRYTLDDLKNEDGTYADSRVFDYEVTENGHVAGVTNDRAVHHVLVTVTDKKNGKLEVSRSFGIDAEGREIRELKFVNAYRAENAVEISGTKKIENRDFREGDSWSFVITSMDPEAPLPQTAERSIQPNAGRIAEFSFGKIHYTLGDLKGKKEKTFTYIVSEKGDVKGVTNDSSHSFTVTVTDNGDGTLGIDTDYGKSGKLEFINTYHAEGGVILEGVKTLEGRDFQEGDRLEFAITGDGKLPDPSVVTIQPKSGKTCAFNFKRVIYTQDDLKDEGGNNVGEKMFVYKVKETAHMSGVASDIAEHTVVVRVVDNYDGTLTAEPVYQDGEKLDFVNVYDAAGDVMIDGHKDLENREFKTGDTWTFAITTDDADAPLPEMTEVSIRPTQKHRESFSFGKIRYTLADLKGEQTKVFYYKVTESGKVSGVRNDAGEHTVRVIVSDRKDGTLGVNAVYSDGEELAFTNTYHASGKVSLKGHKYFDGEAGTDAVLEDGQFTFTVKEDGKVVAAGKNREDGEIEFTDICYESVDAIGEHTYVITEDVPEDAKSFTYVLNGKEYTKAYYNGVVYDLRSIEVKVNVTDKKDGTLFAEMATNQEEISFTNESVHGVTYVRFTKLDQNDNPLAGAHLQILNADGTQAYAYDADGNLTDEKCDWISSADEGQRYRLSDDDSTDDKGTVYYLHEVEAPEGKEKAEDVKFTVRTSMQETPDGLQYEQTNYYDADGNLITDHTHGITMTDLTLTKFEKRAADTKELLAGAELCITDRDGNPVRNAKGEDITAWTTGEANAYSKDGSGVVIAGLADGDYYLKEIKAPDGYEIAEPLAFTIENGRIKGNDEEHAYTVTMYDEKIVIPTPTVTKAPTKAPTVTPTKAPSKTVVVNTGDDTPIALYVILFVTSALGLVLALRRRRRTA